MKKLLIIGARAHAREIHDAVLAINAICPTWDFQGFVSHGKSEPDRIAARGAQILATLEDIDALGLNASEVEYIIGIGSTKARKEIDQVLSAKGFRAATVVHPSAVIGTLNSFGDGCYLAAGVVIQTNVTLGRHAHVNVLASVSHDVQLGNYAMVNPGGRLNGNVKVGEGSVVGANAAIRETLTIGDWCTVGMNAAVVKDVADGLTVVGVPAHPL